MMYVEINDEDQMIQITQGSHKGKRAVTRKMSDGSTVMFILDTAPSRPQVYKVLDVFHVEQVEIPSTLN